MGEVMIDQTMIRKINMELTPEQAKMEEEFIESACEDTEKHIKEYEGLLSSLNGRYICSDLFKETFAAYRESLESRKKYASVIHNSAAVLANELFQRVSRNPKIKKCIFLTGVPGGGKSFLIQTLNMAKEIPNDVMIFEGDITTPTIIDKMRLVRAQGIEIHILVVNPTLELAMDNAISRAFEIGRGASCHTMARIISGLPEAIRTIQKEFGEIPIGIYNKTTNFDIELAYGQEHISDLEYGSYEEVRKKLEDLRTKILKEREPSYGFVEEINGKS